MNSPRATATSSIVLLLLSVAFLPPSSAQETRSRRGFGPRGPQFNSPEVAPDRRITFRILAPQAESVTLAGTDIPDLGPGATMAKAENGVWETTIGPVEPGAYRYSFNVDGVTVIDPKNAATSEANANTWSLVCVAGSEEYDTKNVPHGALAEITYFSSPLESSRRMHVYTPPGYESGQGKFPVLYLLHGAFDCDDSWSTVGRAGFILDNLIADGKAEPMIVVMPAGHTGPFTFGPPRDGDSGPRIDTFEQDFSASIKPYVEENFRVLAGRAYCAIAGLSMGGAQTMNIAVANLEDFAYVGVFSSGVFGIDGGRNPFSPPGPPWEERNREVLNDATLKDGLNLVWFATGKDDFLLRTSQSTVALLRKHGFDVVYHETSGGHTWINWRRYLTDFAQLLFKGPVQAQDVQAAEVPSS